MKEWTLRLGMSLIVMIGVWPNPVPAQEYLHFPKPSEWPEVLVIPTLFWEPDLHPPYPLTLEAAPPPPPSQKLCRRLFNHFGMACGVNEDIIGGNVFEHTHLVYGSSHDFFREPCAPCAAKQGAR
jgi:hypothetical protein